MADKNFKVKSGLNLPITSAAILTTDASGNISSTSALAITNGGTGQTSANNALNALLPIQNGGTVNYTIQSDGTNVSWAKVYNQLIQNGGVSVTPRRNINFVGATLTDNAGSDTTTITFTDNVGVSKSGGDTITASSASVIPVIVKGAASQSANLIEWQNSAGSVLAKVDSAGVIYPNSIVSTGGNANSFGGSTIPGVILSVLTNGAIGQVIRGSSGQTLNLQEWQDSSGTVKAKVEPSGFGYFAGGLTSGGNFQALYSSAFGGATVYASNSVVSVSTAGTSNLGILVKGVSGQTANLQEWQNSAGTVLAKIGSNGDFYWGSSRLGADYGQIFLRGATDYGSSANILTGYSGTKGLVIRGVASQTANLQEWQDSSGTVLASVGSGGWATFVGGGIVMTGGSTLLVSSDIYSVYGKISTGNGVSTPPAQLTTFASSASTIGLIVRGYASQTANLQEWQNSAGGVVATMNIYGTFVAGGNLQTNNLFSVGSAARGTEKVFVLNDIASNVGLIVKGAASQTADLQQWQNSAGTVLASINASGDLTVQNFTVNGTTTTVNSTTLTISDKNIEIAKVTSPTDTTADGAGITIKGTTDKTFNWVQSTAAFTSSEPISAPAFKSAGTAVSSNITLLSGYKYYVDTTSARTLTLPASPSLGDEIVIYDASNSALTNNITVLPNGNKVQGSIQTLIVDSNAAVAYLAYTGSTYGWAVN